MTAAPGARARSTAIVMFTRDLRVHDHPGLAAAVHGADAVVPAFVLDDAILESRFAAPNRLGFLAEALADLDASLRDRGAALVVRRGDWIDEVVRLADECEASVVHVAADVSRYGVARSVRLAEVLGPLGARVELHDGITVVPPGVVLPDGTRPLRGLHPVLPAVAVGAVACGRADPARDPAAARRPEGPGTVRRAR